MRSPSRRQFLKSATAVSAASVLPARTLLAATQPARVNLGIVGCGWRGGQQLGTFRKLPGVTIAGLCDVDQELLSKFGKEVPKAKQWTDMRHMFDSPAIDAVLISTCNHWHCLAAIWAMEAGKHVYVEKPLGQTQWEGQQVIHASEKYDRICQVGTQQRSDPMQAEIKHFLHEEKVIGEIESVRVNRFGERKSIGRRSTPLSLPQSVDYNLWLGPASDLPIYREKLHYDWHWSWNTGSGEIGNWGVHILDDVRNNIFRDKVAAPSSVIAAGGRFQWGDAGDTPNVHFAVLDAGGIPVVVTLSNLPLSKEAAVVPGPRSGYIAYCSEGRLEGQRGKAAAYDSNGKLIKEFGGASGEPFHQQNFIDAIRASDSSNLAAPVKVGYDSTTWSNLINIATRVPASKNLSQASDSLLHRVGSDSTAAIFKQFSDLTKAERTSNSPGNLVLSPKLNFDLGTDQFGRRFKSGQSVAATRGSGTFCRPRDPFL